MASLPLGLRPWAWANRTFLLVVTATAGGLMLVIASAVFGRFPHLIDAATYLFQANGYARGTVVASAPPLPEFFVGGLTIVTRTAWHSIYTPGYPLLLVPGVWAGCPWVVNPVLGALTVALLYGAGRMLYGEAVARTAAVLALLSPFFIFMSGTFMSHTSGALCFALALWGTAGLRHTPGHARHAWAVGVGVAWLGLTRPYSAAWLAIPLLAALLKPLRQRTLPRRHVAILLTTLCVGGAIFVAHQSAIRVRGEVLYHLSVNTAGTLGFRGPLSGAHTPYTPADGLRNFLGEARHFNAQLFGLPGAGAALLCIPMLMLPKTRNRSDALLTGCAWILPLGYVLYYWTDNVYGPRYWFEAMPAYLLLSARGLHVGIHAVGRRWGVRRRPFVRLALACQLLATATRTFPAFAGTYAGNYMGPGDYLRPHLAGLDRALVFLESNSPESMGNWIMAHDDPALARPILLAHDRKHQNHDLARHFPDRPTYRYTIYFHGDLQGSTVAFEQFASIDTAAELQAHLRSERTHEAAGTVSDAP